MCQQIVDSKQKYSDKVEILKTLNCVQKKKLRFVLKCINKMGLQIIYIYIGDNEEITLHPSSISSHFFCVYSSFLSKRSEEFLLIFFRVFGNFKNA